MTTGSRPRRGRRRANGDGSITQRSDGRWCGRLSLPDRKRQSFYGHSYAEVRGKLRDAHAALGQGLALPDDRLTLATFLERWLSESVLPSVRHRTALRYAQLVHTHIVPELGTAPLSKLTPQHVQQFLNAKGKAGLSPRTVQYLRVTLVRALGEAERWSLVPRNVARLVPGPHVPRREVSPLSPEQARCLLTSLKEDPHYALYYLALASGLRQGELLGLHWEDIDFDDRRLRVRYGLTWQDGSAVFAEPKTTRSRRTLALDSDTISVLRAHKSHQSGQRLRAGRSWQDQDLVFTNALGGPLEGTGVTQHFRRALERGGLPRMRFHDLRHGAASLLLSRGVSLRVVMERLGHSQIGVTANTYAHVIPELDREAADLIGGALTGAD
jgi:integrase